MGAEFITCDNAVNALLGAYYRKVRLIRLYSNFFMSFLLPADYPPCGLSGGNYGTIVSEL